MVRYASSKVKCWKGNSDLTDTCGNKDPFIIMAMPPPRDGRGNERVVYPDGNRSLHFASSTCDPNQDSVVVVILVY